jgi:hypothetical protein
MLCYDCAHHNLPHARCPVEHRFSLTGCSCFHWQRASWRCFSWVDIKGMPRRNRRMGSCHPDVIPTIRIRRTSFVVVVIFSSFHRGLHLVCVNLDRPSGSISTVSSVAIDLQLLLVVRTVHMDVVSCLFFSCIKGCNIGRYVSISTFLVRLCFDCWVGIHKSTISLFSDAKLHLSNQFSSIGFPSLNRSTPSVHVDTMRSTRPW